MVKAGQKSILQVSGVIRPVILNPSEVLSLLYSWFTIPFPISALHSVLTSGSTNTNLNDHVCTAWIAVNKVVNPVVSYTYKTIFLLCSTDLPARALVANMKASHFFFFELE